MPLCKSYTHEAGPDDRQYIPCEKFHDKDIHRVAWGHRTRKVEERGLSMGGNTRAEASRMRMVLPSE